MGVQNCSHGNFWGSDLKCLGSPEIENTQLLFFPILPGIKCVCIGGGT